VALRALRGEKNLKNGAMHRTLRALINYLLFLCALLWRDIKKKQRLLVPQVSA